MPAQEFNAAQKKALNDALGIAVQAADLDMMKSAVGAGAEANLLMFNGIIQKQLSWVEAAVSLGADVNSTAFGLYPQAPDASKSYPAFFWLNRYFSEEVAEFLFSKGARVDQPGPDGGAALLKAVIGFDFEPAKFLVSHGADPLLPDLSGTFALKEVEERSWDSTRRVTLIKLMVENMDRKKQEEDAKAAANDIGAVTTSSEVELGRPLELRKKPAGPVKKQNLSLEL